MNPTFLTHVAIGTVILIVLAFILGTHPFKKKKQLFVLQDEPLSPQWYASECFMFLKAQILTCNTSDELNKCRIQVETFYDREFRAPITRAERKRYYARLLETIATKEDSFRQKLLDPNTEAFYHT